MFSLLNILVDKICDGCQSRSVRRRAKLPNRAQPSLTASRIRYHESPRREVAVLSPNYRMSEILVEMPDAIYHYLTVSGKFRRIVKTGQPITALQECEISRVLHHFFTETDGFVIQCALSSCFDAQEIGVVTIRISTMLIEDGNIFTTLSNMVMAMLGYAAISMTTAVFSNICTLVQPQQGINGSEERILNP